MLLTGSMHVTPMFVWGVVAMRLAHGALSRRLRIALARGVAGPRGQRIEAGPWSALLLWRCADEEEVERRDRLSE